MKNKKSGWPGGVVVVLCVLVGATSVATATETDANHPVRAQGAPQYTDRLIVKRRGAVTGQHLAPGANALQALTARAGVALAFTRRMSGGADVLRLPHRMTLAEVDEIARRLRADPDVEYAEPDRIMHPLLAPGIPNDPGYEKQWHYHAPEDGKAGRANLPGAWDIATGSEAIVVAVIDTGLVFHGDIHGAGGRVLPGYDFVSDSYVANDGDGWDPDPSDPGDWVDSGKSHRFGCPASASSWHGTHVAGTIGALGDNGMGVAGVDWRARLLPVRVLGKCGGYESDVIEAVRWAAGMRVESVPKGMRPEDVPDNPHPAHVLNLSLGVPGPCGTGLQQAVSAVLAKGKVIVAAAGNDGGEVANSAPANCDGVITVAAVNEKGRLARYSNSGSRVAISAPGGEQDVDAKILSTSNTGRTGPVEDAYTAFAGTSMAAAHVSGIASLMLSVDPDLDPPRIGEVLKQTARPFPDGNGRNCAVAEWGAGIVDAAAAVRAVQAALALPAPNSPTADAGPDQAASHDMTITLRGSGVSENGAIERYQWRQVGGTPVVLCADMDDAAKATIEPPLPAGTLTFQLTVQDGTGLMGTDTVNVTVENVPPVLAPIGDKTVTAGAVLNFTVSATDANGTPPRLSASGLPAGAFFNSVTGRFEWSNARPIGKHHVTFTATDSADPLITVSETIVINVTPVVSGGGSVDMLMLAVSACLLRYRPRRR